MIHSINQSNWHQFQMYNELREETETEFTITEDLIIEKTKDISPIESTIFNWSGDKIRLIGNKRIIFSKLEGSSVVSITSQNIEAKDVDIITVNLQSSPNCSVIRAHPKKSHGFDSALFQRLSVTSALPNLTKPLYDDCDKFCGVITSKTVTVLDQLGFWKRVKTESPLLNWKPEPEHQKVSWIGRFTRGHIKKYASETNTPTVLVVQMYLRDRPDYYEPAFKHTLSCTWEEMHKIWDETKASHLLGQTDHTDPLLLRTLQHCHKNQQKYREWDECSGKYEQVSDEDINQLFEQAKSHKANILKELRKIEKETNEFLK